MLIAIDTGGTKTLITGFTSSGTPTKAHRFATPKDKNEYTKSVIAILEEHFDPQAIDGVTVALPGIIRDNIAVWCSNLGWENFDITSHLRTFIGDAPVFVENDANLAGLAEAKARTPVPPLCLYVTVSTGIGTGIIINGQIEPALSASEGGHALVEYDNIVQEWQEFASGKAIRHEYGKYAREIDDRATWNEIADKISRGFLSLIPILQPDVIVIGGSIGTFFDQYSAELQSLLREKLPRHIPCPPIEKALHPEEAVIYGCYYYGTQKLSTQ